MGRPAKGITLEDRFWPNVDKTRRCWDWVGYSANGRYGHIKIGARRVSAHVVSYEMHVGKVPAGLKVLHSCDNTRCVNPKHLFLGTMKDNIQDMLRKGRGADRSLLASSQWRRWRARRATREA